MYILLAIVLSVTLFFLIVFNLPVFGRKPSGVRLENIKKLPTYRDGAIQNLSFTPMKPKDVSYLEIISGMLKKNKRRTPFTPLPSVKPDFSLSTKIKVIWFGHSTYLLQVEGVNILVDPVFSVTPSPFSFLGYKNFKGTDFVDPSNLPELDVILITHDHYDHLDYKSILKLNGKTTRFITSLGVGAHLESWNIPAEKITELKWGEAAVLESGIKFTAAAARHFTGRLFKRNQTLWSSFILQTPQAKIYLGGDSGYDIHFKEIGAQHGPFDLAILECGQYNVFWPYIHMFPEQTVEAAIDLNAMVLLPVHWGKFTLALHDWNDPIIRVVKQAAEKGLKITTPLLGESVVIGDNYPAKEWWLDV